MDNISIVIQDKQNPISIQTNTEFNSIQDNQPIFIHKTHTDGSIEIIDLITWNNDIGTFSADLTNTNTYIPSENIFYAYTGNSNHIEIVRMSEIDKYSIPVIYFLESSKYYYEVSAIYEKKINNTKDKVEHILSSIVTDPSNYAGQIYLNRFPDPYEFRSILTELKDNIIIQLDTNPSNFITGYVKLVYNIYKVYPEGPNQIIKTLNTSMILIPPTSSNEDITRTKIIGIETGYDETSPSLIQDVDCLKRESEINVIGGKYLFNGTSSYTNNLYGINEGEYRLINIPKSHPMAIINKGPINITYKPDNKSPIIINVAPKLDPGQFPPSSIDHHFTFTSSNESIYFSNNQNIPGISVFQFMKNRSYIFKTSNIDSKHFFLKLKSNTFILNDKNSMYIHISNDITLSDDFSCGYVIYSGDEANSNPDVNTRLSLLIKEIDGYMYDFVYGDMVLNIPIFDESTNYTLSAYCYYHGYMGAQDKIIFDRSCSKIKYNLVNLIDTQKFRFDITNQGDINNEPQNTIDNIDYSGYHNIYKKSDILSNNFQIIGNYNYLFLDLNFNIDYTLPDNISSFPPDNYPFKMLLNNSNNQKLDNSAIVGNHISTIDSLDINFITNNFKNFFTSVKVGNFENESYVSRIPLVFRDNLDPNHPGINFLFFKYTPNNITYLHAFNATETNPYYLSGYDSINDYNPIYRSDSSYVYIIQSYSNNYITFDFDNIDNYLDVNGYISIEINKLSELGLQVILNDSAGDIVIPNPILKIYKAYYTNENDEIFEFPNNLDIINLVKSNNYLNLKLSLSYEDDKGNISLFPSNLNNLDTYYKFINSQFQPENDDPGLTFQFKDTTILTYPIAEVVNHHNMFQPNFVYPSGTSSYADINVDNITDIKLMSSHIQQSIYSNVRLNMTSITYYNGVNINKLPLSQYTYEIVNQITDTENIHLLIKLDSIYEYDLKALKMFTLIRGNPQFDVYSNVILSSNFLDNDIPILLNDEALVDTGMLFEYKTLSLTGSTNNKIGYFDNVTLKIKISSDTEPTHDYSLGFLNHIFLLFNNEPNKLQGISTNIYNSYIIYKNLTPKPELNRFTYYLSNDLSVPINTLQDVNSQITIDNNLYASYKIALVDNNFTISNFSDVNIPLLFLKYNDNVNNININGVTLNLDSNVNDIIGIGNGLSIIVLANDNNLIEVKIADFIDLITNLTSFISTIKDVQKGDKDTMSRAYSRLNNIYKNDDQYDNLPIIISNKNDIDIIIESACEFLEKIERFKTLYLFPITGNQLFLPNINGVIRFESIVYFTTTNIENQVLVKIKDIDYSFIQNKQEMIVNGRKLRLGEFTMINNIKFHYIGFGSLYILMNNSKLCNNVHTGIGGDPYISNLQGLKYKIPSSNSFYNYIDNCENNIHNRFIINFETYLLEGKDLSELNEFVMDQIMKKNNLDSIRDVPLWLYKNGLKLDMNACFIKKVYIKNGRQEFIFDIDKFKVYSINYNELSILPSRFTPIVTNDFNMNNVISSHINLNEHKPYKGIKIQTETSSFGTVTIEFMKYYHPQIRNNINVIFEKNPLDTSSIGGIVKNRYFILDDITSYPSEEDTKLITNTVSEIYVGNLGEIKLEKIKQ